MNPVNFSRKCIRQRDHLYIENVQKINATESFLSEKLPPSVKAGVANVTLILPVIMTLVLATAEIGCLAWRKGCSEQTLSCSAMTSKEATAR